jgi:hypothetical protein
MRCPRLLAGIAVLALAASSGCTGMTRTVSYQFPQTATAARVILQDAGAAGPVLIEARNSPFAGDVAAPLAAAASRTIPGLGTVFTADRAAAPRADHRLIFQFHPGDHVTANQVCGPTPLAAQPVSRDQLVTFVVFCQGPRPVLAAMQWAPMPQGIDSPVIRGMAEQAVLRMFVTDNDTNSPSDYWPD